LVPLDAGRDRLGHRHLSLLDLAARSRCQVRTALDDRHGARRVKGERGQVVVLTAVMLMALLGLGAMVLDVGAWFRTKRQVQATADAAALAGAQELHLADGQPQAVAV